LQISNGKWHWFSRGIGGRTALDYLIKVQGFSFTQAVEMLAGQSPAPSPTPQVKPKEQELKVLSLPPPSRCATYAVRYLHGRGIDYELIDYCIRTGRLYESHPYHNVVFVGRDWRQYALLSLAGVFKQTCQGVVPLALTQYLQDPGTRTMYLHLDNDEIGRSAAAGITESLKDRYKVLDQPTPSGKDVNEFLQRRLGLYKEKEDREQER